MPDLIRHPVIIDAAFAIWIPDQVRDDNFESVIFPSSRMRCNAACCCAGPGSGHAGSTDSDPVSAEQHFMLQSARDDDHCNDL